MGRIGDGRLMKRIALPTLTLPRLVVALTFLAIFAMAARVSADTDTWWHLRTGQWIVENGAVPQTDPFSWTRAGEPWRIPGWLVQAPLYWLFANFGYAGLNLFTAACVTLTFALVYPTCSGHPLLRAFALVLAATVSGIYWSARPQIVSLLLAAAFGLILYRWRLGTPPSSPEHEVQAQERGEAGRGVRLWALPVLMALWANAHGGFAIGFIFIGLTLAGEVLKIAWAWFATRHVSPFTLQRIAWLVGITLLCALAVALNPAGPERLLYPLKTVSIGALREFIQEWQSPNFHELSQQPFLWLLLLTFAAVALSRRPADVTDLALVGGAAYLGFLAGRNMPLLALTAPALLTRHAAYLLDDARKRDPASPAPGRIALNWILLVVFTLLALVKIISVLPGAVNEAAIAKTVPVAAADFVRRERPAGPLFNSYNFGAYLMWALPEYPVYVDGRTDLYDDAFLREYLSVAFGRPGWAEALRERGVRLVLIEADSLLGDRLRESDAWREAYRDAIAAVYERVEP
jgi:hypothetical protein